MKKFLTSITLMLLCLKAHTAIIYVNANATGSNNGTSWTNAYTDLQAALSVAFVNDDIWVATGTYKPTSTTSRSISFVMRNGVDMYGGFNGTETAVEQRNITANPTTLSGDIGSLGDNTDNTYRVVKVENFTTAFTFDGFRVVSGYNANSSSDGAGMYLADNPGPLITIKNTVLYNNFVSTSGGGMYVENSRIDFYNCAFLYNSTSATGSGGALYVPLGATSELHFYDTQFIGNYSRSGVVLYCRSSGEVIMERVLVTNNTTSNLPSSSDIIMIDSETDYFEMNNSLVAGNQIYSPSGSVLSIGITVANACSMNNTTVCHNKNIYPTPSSREIVFHTTNFNTTMAINNCIVFGNTPSDLNAQINADVNAVSNSVVENGFAGGINIVTTDPGFVNPGTLAAAPFDASLYDYSLLMTSPAVNHGNNTYAQSFSTDYAGNARIQQLTVDCGALESPYADIIPPVANCASPTVYLDAMGTVVIDSSDVDAGSTDNAGIVSRFISETTFDCFDVGTQQVSLIISDAAGNADTCVASVTIVDALPPVIAAQNVSVYLDATGNASVTAASMDTGTTDNCALDTLFISQTDFNCNDTGPNSITFTAIDVNGNSASVTRTVTVIDSVAPVAIAQNRTIYLNANGNASVTAAQINNGSYDDCTIAGMTASPTSFNCNGTGPHTVTLTVTDGSGNTHSATATVTVLDTITPVTNGQDITINLAVSDPYIITPANINNGSDDNCSFTQSIDINSFNAVGVYYVQLTTTDASGNSSSGVYQVTVIQSAVGTQELQTTVSEVYPNPTTGTVHVRLSGTAPQVNTRLVDITEKIIRQDTFYQTELFDIPLEGTPGFYILEINTSGNDWAKVKIVRQ